MRIRQLICTITAICVLSMLSSCSQDGSTYTIISTDQTSSSDITQGSQTSYSETTDGTTAENTDKLPVSVSEVKTIIDFSGCFDENIDDKVHALADPVMIDDNTLCMAYKVNDNASDQEFDCNNMHVELCIADIHTGELKQHIILPTANYDRISNVLPEGEEGVCCLFSEDFYYNDDNITATHHNYVTITSDYSFKTNDSITSDDIAMISGNHRISRDPKGDIIDCQSGETIVQGIYSGLDEMTNQYKIFDYAIDEDRFVYSTSQWETINGIGIYDYLQKKCIDVPESENFHPIGVCNKKIYSRKSFMSPPDPEFYVTDPDTLETTVIFDSSKYDQKYALSNGFVAAGGKYIVLNSETDDNVLLIKPDNGDVVSEFSFGLEKSWDVFLLGENVIGMYESINKKLHLLNINDVIK